MAFKPSRATIAVDSKGVYLTIDGTEYRLAVHEARKMGEELFKAGCMPIANSTDNTKDK